jgi:hypothetical protein
MHSVDQAARFAHLNVDRMQAGVRSISLTSVNSAPGACGLAIGPKHADRSSVMPEV